MISIDEMLAALRRIKKIPDDARLQKIVEVLDADNDGHINVSHVLEVKFVLIIQG